MTPTPIDAVLRTFHEGQLRLRQRLEAAFFFSQDPAQLLMDAQQIIAVEYVQLCLELARTAMEGGLAQFPDEIMPEIEGGIEETIRFINALGKAH